MELFVNGERTNPEAYNRGAGTAILFGRLEESGQAETLLGLDTEALARCRAYQAMRYDNGPGFDYIYLELIDLRNPSGPPKRAEVYIDKNTLAIFHEPMLLVDEVIESIERAKSPPAPGEVLYGLFSRLTWDDTDVLGDMEEEIGSLEDSMVAADGMDCTAQISDLRHRILLLKRYYEALLDLFEDAGENRNGLLSAEQLKSAAMLVHRTERLFHLVQNLRDYVTQVRESYQSQMDIKLNEIVKFLTIVTTVSVPLQLIVGWYGMNLLMPEYTWQYGYPIVAVLCLAISLALVVYFRKKKWL